MHRNLALSVTHPPPPYLGDAAPLLLHSEGELEPTVDEPELDA